MKKRPDPGTILAFSHRRKAEVEELLVADDRLREVEAAIQQFLKVGPKGQIAKTTDLKSLSGRSFYCFAAVTYARCFSSGRRKKLKVEEIETLTDQDRELHEEIRRLRNQYFAHAVMDQEGAHVYLHAEKSEKKPSRFAIIQVVMLGDGDETAQRFLSLVQKIRSHLASRISEAGDEIAKSFFGTNATWNERTAARKRRA